MIYLINMDYNKEWYWLNNDSRHFLQRGYLAEGQTAEERIEVIANKAEKYLGIDGYAEKLMGYVAKGWVSFSSPVWSNFGSDKGLPISCFGSYVGDNMGSILYSHAEAGMMSKYGGGCSGYLGDLRGRGVEISGNGASSGAVHFTQLFETLVDVVSQGSVRRGHFSPYLPVEHPDIMEFLEIGTEGNPIQKLTGGVTVTDEWMESMKDGDEKKREIWAKVLQRRREMGYPYIVFIDNANDAAPDVYRNANLKIHASNMCSEIMLPSTDNWSFVCCLSSVNLTHYREWENTDLVQTVTFLLDAVMEEFIEKLAAMRDSEEVEKRRAFSFLERAHNFAEENRALGLGVLGYHSLLQREGIPFESQDARDLNTKIFARIQRDAEEATAELAMMFGEPEMLVNTGKRNTTLMAIAPTTSSAFILGQVSQGIEPIWSNCYVKDVAKMKVTIKNQMLEFILEALGQNTKEVWNNIRDHDGSVQHLDFLSEREKAVFKTFAELDQGEVIQQAADRQKYIDQGQSLNVMVDPNTPVKDVNKLYMDAWRKGLKSLYYQHSMNAAQQMVRKKLLEAQDSDSISIITDNQ